MVFQIKNKIVMKKFLLILAITCQLSGFAQKMFTRSGVIKFEASMPAFEEIAATNNSVSCVFDKTNGDIATLALMKAFKFKSPLMEEHFNENYVESDKYPNATFSGKVKNIGEIDFTRNGVYQTTVEGDLTIKGITKKVTEKGTFEVKDGKVIGKSTFNILLADYGIKIPNTVASNISKTIQIDVEVHLEKLAK